MAGFPPLSFSGGGSAAQTGALYISGPEFGDYSASPISGSGNASQASGGLINSAASGGVPLWVWAAVVAGAIYLKKKGK